MAKRKPATWEEIVNPLILDEIGEKRQVRLGVTKISDNSLEPLVNIRIWEKYVTKEEKAEGISIDDVDFRPTTKGLTIPVSQFKAFCNTVSELQEILEEEGLLVED